MLHGIRDTLSQSVIVWLVALLITAGGLAAEPAVDVLMLGSHSPRAREVYWPRFREACAKQGVRVHILMGGQLIRYKNYPLEALKKFPVIVFHDRPEDYSFGGEADPKAEAAAFRETLEAYHRAGGGILWVPLATDFGAVRWTELVGKRYGAQALNERLYDLPKQVNLCPSVRSNIYNYLWTTNVAEHPVTAGVRGLMLPLTGEYNTAGTIPMKFGSDWQVLVRGMESTGTIPAGDGHAPQPDPKVKGTYAAAPELVAVREGQEGAGRMMVLPVHPTHTWLNFGHFAFNNAFMLNGDGAHPSDGLRFFLNSCKWLAVPGVKAGLGGFKEPVQREKPEFTPIDWAKADFQAESWSGLGGWWDDLKQQERSMDDLVTPGARDFRGLFGIHTAASDGQGTVAEYVAEAKKQGLSFLVILEDLAATDDAKYAKTVADCQASTTPDFLAVPGYQFRDVAGVLHYVYATDQLPKAENLTPDRRVRVPVQIIDQNSWKNGYGIAEVGKSPVNPWRLFLFTSIAPFTWEGDKLSDDGLQRNLFDEGLGNNYPPVALVQIRRPEDLAKASQAAHQTVVHAANVGLMPSYLAKHGSAHPYPVYITNGPTIQRWGALNPLGMPYWPGKQRLRVALAVESAAGLAEVVIRDANSGTVFRRFTPKGEKRFSCTIDETHRTQYSLVPVITDVNGRTAVGSTLNTYQDGNRLWLMGDRLMGMNESRGWDAARRKLMTLPGWLGLTWIKPYLEAGTYPPNPRGAELTINGMDGGSFHPAAFDFNPRVDTTAGVEPKVTGFQFRPRLASFDYAVMDYEGKTQFLVNKRHKKESAWWESPEQEVPTEIADILVRVWAVKGRHLADVAANVHEMTVTFKKDTVLKRIDVCSFRKCEAASTLLFVCDREGESGWLVENKQEFNRQGVLPAGGYVYPANNRGGSPGLINLGPQELNYQTNGHGGTIFIDGGNRAVKAGETITVRFVSFTKPWLGQNNNVWLRQYRNGFGLGGSQPGYGLAVTQGKLLSTNGSVDIEAQNGGATLTVKKFDLPHNLAVRVSGLPAAAVTGRYDLQKKQLLILPVLEGMAPTSINTTLGDTALYVGELLHCDNPNVILCATQDGADRILLEIHNPTEQPCSVRLTAAPGFAPLAGLAEDHPVPPCSSIKTVLKTAEKTLLDTPYQGD